MTHFNETAWYRALVDSSSRKLYSAGETIQFQGQAVETVGIVISGCATAIAYSENGNETWLGEYQEGRFIGLVSLLTNKYVSFELRAETDLILLAVPARRMLNLLSHHVSLANAVAQDLALRLGLSLSDLLNVHTLSAKARICIELSRLSLPIGLEPGKDVIRPSPIFVDLARRINSTRETVSRTVSELQKMGIVSRGPGVLIIQMPSHLEAAFQSS